ncbi:MAG: tRNA (adenosine(37)-N6)-threonylcarbamoyltransferase complex ATPase subunit type 1 TsaE [Opitutia bacterium AMD-G1]|nr:MAG: tRNA (adenosine(37)-N6)-threonylcarbamoyltransferase complex ATPase subunit type 1 TsaE [Opitutae bacterium AMD-G1]
MGSPATLATWTAGLVTRSGEETERAAEAFAALLPPDTVLALEGDLGAGKTTFVRGLVRGLGVTGDITSPSFALLNVYEGRRQVFHVDAYRLTQPEAFDDLLIWDLAKSPWNVANENRHPGGWRSSVSTDPRGLAYLSKRLRSFSVR